MATGDMSGGSMIPGRRYLGDGVYASFDGYQVWLAVDRDGEAVGIAVEPRVWDALKDYVNDVARAALVGERPATTGSESREGSLGHPPQFDKGTARKAPS